MSLREDQQQALAQLREITDGGDDDVAIGVLSSVGWDVQKAAEMIFDGVAPPPSPPRQPLIETFDVDDSNSDENESLLNRPERPSHRPTSYTSMILRPVFSFLAIPLHIVSGLLRFVFGILRIPFPQFRFSSLTFHRPLSRPSTRRGPDRWLRDLEEETGAVSIGRLKTPRGVASSLSLDPSRALSSRGAGPSSGLDDGRKLLPDFVTCSYEELLRTVQRDAKIACVILLSDEHDDVPEFKRSTLTESTFVKALYDNGILVWGGDVRDQEAWSASEKLQATTYPFVAFLALQPRRILSSTSSINSSSSSPPPSTLTILSRHQGPSIPASTGPTSAQILVDHIERSLLPRVTPFLNRLLAVQRERERDRHLREEQDRAFQNAAMRDRERIEARMAQERAEADARRKVEEDARRAAEQRAHEAHLARQRDNDRMDWRRWTRCVVVGESNAATAQTNGNARGGLRFAIRLPSGTRVVHQFTSDATLTSLYAFVDVQFIPSTLPPSTDPAILPGQLGEGAPALETHLASVGHPSEYWGFQVVTAYPRVEIPWRPATKLSEIEQLKGGGQIVVETITSPRPSLDNPSADGDDDDGYHTEDSDQ